MNHESGLTPKRSDERMDATPSSGLIAPDDSFFKPQPHALPFRAIFRESYARDKRKLKRALDPKGEKTDELLLRDLDEQLSASETAYAELAKAKAELGDTAPLEAACANADAPLLRILHSLDASSLCLSGGGIRSASYCLGVLEGLARYSQGIAQTNASGDLRGENRLLQSLDYLSTVSGGGYIGSWLTAWIFRTGNDQKAYDGVVRALAGQTSSTSGDPEPQPVRHLRDYTSFLAPKLGLSLDTWALVAIVLRNLLVNWIMIVPLLIALVALPQVVRYSMEEAADGCSPTDLLVLVLLSLLVSAVTAAIRMPSRRFPSGQPAPPLPAKNREPWIVFSCFVVPIFLAAVCLAEIRLNQANSQYSFDWKDVGHLFEVGVACFLVIALPRIRSRAGRGSGNQEFVSAGRVLRRFLECAGAACFVAALAAIALDALAAAPAQSLLDRSDDKSLFILLAIPMIFTLLLITSSILSGLLGLFEDEIDREWWARAGGLLIFVGLGWASSLALAIYGPALAKSLATLVPGVIAGISGVSVGASGKTSSGAREMKSSQLGSVGKFLAKYHLVVPALCACGLLVIGFGISLLESYLALTISATEWMRSVQTNLSAHVGLSPSSGLTGHASILIASVTIGLLANWFININIFSLHGMYRMRLMRAFLGASNTKRRPDDFVDFDPKDSPYEADLPRAGGVPLHVINSTLNLVGTQELAWQQRKAESFTFNPVLCGGWRLGYVPTEMYAGRQGPSLATAMAISGAAFNPNMGYHSSPLVTLLMTFFNVRLGWWLPNPARAKTEQVSNGGEAQNSSPDKKKGDPNGRSVLSRRGERFLHKSGPTMALRPLVWEALGKTDATSKWIELTDGAHFENLALYEMVLRRCHRIIVVDVGADPDYQFEDLGNALRKIEIDLGIPIRFERQPTMHKPPSPDTLYCAVARIEYNYVDGAACPNVPDGELVYIKACLRGDEPPDIRQYAATHSSFPHETTANQFYNESQFESYRHLGSYVIDQIVEKGIANAQVQNSQFQPGFDMQSFYETAEAYSKAT